MAEGQLNVILSEGLRKIIENLKEKHDSEIAKQLINADDLVKAYNFMLPRGWEEGDLAVSRREGCKVLKQQIYSVITEEVSMLSFRESSFEISYLPKGKEVIYSDSDRKIWSRKNRQSGKPGRIVQKLLIAKFTCKDFEDFSNQIKSEFDIAGEFRIVEGDDIARYYNSDTYYKINSSLGNSCMRYEECRRYFDIYKDHARMLCYFRDDMLMGRAIIWNIDGNTYMDRVYVCEDYLEGPFYEYAEFHKWIVRSNNALLHDGDRIRWLGPQDNYKEPFIRDLSIELTKRYDYMPYVDTFRYYDSDDNCISTDPEYGDCYLSNTDGSYDCSQMYECAACGDTFRGYNDEMPDDLHYSEYADAYYCTDCCWYSEYLEDYIPNSARTEDVYTDNNRLEELPLSYIEGNGWFTEIDGDWYHIECDKIELDKESGEYKLIEEEEEKDE